MKQGNHREIIRKPRILRRPVTITLEESVLAAVDARNENRSEEINSALKRYYANPSISTIP